MTALAHLRPGFASPVMEAQATFRAVLHALSYPGRVMEAGGELDPPVPLHHATAAIALSLFDLDTPVWLDPAAWTPETEAFLRFHTGCPLVDDPAIARFAVIADAARLTAFDAFDAGSDEAPDRSATLIVQVSRFLQRSGGVTLCGPGIRNPLSVLVDGVSREFWQARRAQQALFPRGVDVVFTAEHRLVGLSRTTHVEL